MDRHPTFAVHGIDAAQGLRLRFSFRALPQEHFRVEAGDPFLAAQVPSALDQDGNHSLDCAEVHLARCRRTWPQIPRGSPGVPRPRPVQESLPGFGLQVQRHIMTRHARREIARGR